MNCFQRAFIGFLYTSLMQLALSQQLNIQCYVRFIHAMTMLNTFLKGANQSPIKIKTEVTCENNVDHPFELGFLKEPITLTSVMSDFHKKYKIERGIGVILKVVDTQQKLQQFSLTSIEIYTPARHRISLKQKQSDINGQDYIIGDIELVFYMHSENSQDEIQNAGISFIFQSKDSSIEKWVEDASFMLKPFAFDKSENNISLNVSEELNDYYSLKKNNGFYQYRGTKIAEDCENESYNWFVYDKILGVSNDIKSYFYTKYGDQNILSGVLRTIQQFNHNPITKVGCFPQFYVNQYYCSYYDQYSSSNQEKMNLKTNKGFWVYTFLFAIYFISAIKRPNPQNIFTKQFQQNSKTLIPLYSICHVEHDKYFNKNCRSTLYLLQICIMIFTSSIFIHYNSNMMLLSISLYSIASMLISFPICYAMGLLNSMQYQQSRILLDNEIKIIIQASEHSTTDDEQYIQSIENTQFKSHLLSYSFYAISIIAINTIFITSSFIMETWSEWQFIQWVMSALVMIGLDYAIDLLISTKLYHKMPFFAKKGYYLDYQLAELIQKNQNIKILR